MKRREYEKKLREWEAEGYDVSELREKWFPIKKAEVKDYRYNRVILALTAIFIVLSSVVVWQAVKPAPIRVPTPAPAPAQTPIQWLNYNWLLIVTPVLVFFAFFVAGQWLRRVAYDVFGKWA